MNTTTKRDKKMKATITQNVQGNGNYVTAGGKKLTEEQIDDLKVNINEELCGYFISNLESPSKKEWARWNECADKVELIIDDFVKEHNL